MKECHSILAIADLTASARHEAGHLLMLWSMEREAAACGGRRLGLYPSACQACNEKDTAEFAL